MTAALRALMTGVIDHAGMFPPAKLSLADAMAEYLAIRESPECWMLGRFVVAAENAAALSKWSARFGDAKNGLRLAVTGPSSTDITEFPITLESTLQYVERLTAKWKSPPIALSLELRLPDEISTVDIARIPHLLDETVDQIRQSLKVQSVFFEAPALLHDESLLRTLTREIGARSTVTQQKPKRPILGLKLRTGGLTPEMFPTVSQVADVVESCAAWHCPWKATAGLHHPLRHADAELETTMHGFLNVLMGSTLASADKVSRVELEEVLSEESANAFQFDDSTVSWKDREVDLQDIESNRNGGFQSFGSCSFDEPRDDLKQLGLL